MKFFLLLAVILGALATPQLEDGVYVLTEDNFDDFIANNEFVLVEFYAPWCGHCKALTPEYAAAAQTLAAEGSPVKLAKVDATVHQSLGNRFQLQGYPTLKWFRSGKPSEYDGERKSASIVSWISKKSGPSSVSLTTQAELDAFLAKDGILFVAYTKQADAWLAVTKEPAFDEFFGAHVTDESLWGANKEGVALYKKGEDTLFFDGGFGSDFLAWASVEGYPLIEDLAQPVWTRSSKTQSPLLAVFHNNEQKESATELLTKVAKGLKGKALFSISDRIQLLEQWGASGHFTPSAILIQWDGEVPKFKIWNENNGLEFNEENLIAFINDVLAGTYVGFRKSEPIPENNESPVVTLVGKNFEEIVFAPGKVILIEFYAAWCGHCKKLTPVWEELAAAEKLVHPQLTIAKIDATLNGLPDDISIQGFPTIILFQDGQRTIYEGGRELAQFQSWLADKLGAGEKTDL